MERIEAVASPVTTLSDVERVKRAARRFGRLIGEPCVYDVPFFMVECLHGMEITVQLIELSDWWLLEPLHRLWRQGQREFTREQLEAIA